MPEKVLDFEGERDAETKSWERASREALIERTAWNKWRVTLPDGDDAHEVRLERDHGALVGQLMSTGGVFLILLGVLVLAGVLDVHPGAAISLAETAVGLVGRLLGAVL